MGRDRNQMAERAAAELQDGWYVNLGIGIPTPVANYTGDKDITLRSRLLSIGSGMPPGPTRIAGVAEAIRAIRIPASCRPPRGCRGARRPDRQATMQVLRGKT